MAGNDSDPRQGAVLDSVADGFRIPRLGLRAGVTSLVVATLILPGCGLAAATQAITSTISVARNFEIRDHEQASKHVFNGSTRVANVIGSLSMNSRIQRLRLWPGWNLCSVAVSGSLAGTGNGDPAEVIYAAHR